MIIFFISVGTVALLCFYYGDVEPLSSTIHYDKQYSFGWDLLNFVQRLCTLKFIGSFTIDDGDISENVTLKKTSLFQTLSRLFRLANGEYSWNWILGDLSKVRKRQKSSSCCVFVVHKTSSYSLGKITSCTSREMSRQSHSMQDLLAIIFADTCRQ